MRLPGFPDTPYLSLSATALPDGSRSDPVLAFSPSLGETDALMRLDPTRPDVVDTSTFVRRSSPRGPIDSLILHLLALAMIIGWPPQTSVDIPAPIPVELVIEQPPPAQKDAPKLTAKPVQGRLASDDFAPAVAPRPEKGAADASQSAAEPQPPAAEPRSEAAPAPVPLTEPDRSKEPAPAESQPTAPATRLAAAAPPVPPKPPAKPAMPPTPAVLRMPKLLGSEWPLPLHEDHPQVAARPARLIGPSAVRDEYCARLLSLTLRNIGLLPLSAIGARHGATTVTFRLTGDGTVNSVKIERSSGYPDIDEKIAQMVIAVGHFPPLPQWIPGQYMDFTFDLHFPHPLQR